MRFAHHLIPVVLLLSSGCYSNHPTPISACQSVAGSSLARGALRQLPNQVPEVVVDSAVWSSTVNSPELATETDLRYQAYLHVTTATPLSAFAVAFHSNRPAEDSALRVSGPTLMLKTQYGGSTGGEQTFFPGQVRFALAFFWRPGEGAGDWGCPASMQVVRVGSP